VNDERRRILAQARAIFAVALGEMERHPEDSRSYEAAAERIGRAAGELIERGRAARSARAGLALVGHGPDFFHPDIERGPAPRGLGRRNAPEVCP
jgi:hypothetical protein